MCKLCDDHDGVCRCADCGCAICLEPENQPPEARLEKAVQYPDWLPEYYCAQCVGAIKSGVWSLLRRGYCRDCAEATRERKEGIC